VLFCCSEVVCYCVIVRLCVLLCCSEVMSVVML